MMVGWWLTHRVNPTDDLQDGTVDAVMAVHSCAPKAMLAHYDLYYEVATGGGSGGGWGGGNRVDRE